MLFWLQLLTVVSFSHTEKFDIVTYTSPKGWQKETGANNIQFGKENGAHGTFCIVMMFKALPAGPDSRRNFDAARETLVKDAVSPSAAPDMQTPVIDEKGWTAQSGFAPYENEGKQGVLMLVSTTGNNKVLNILILTNSDIYQEVVFAFVDSIVFPDAKQHTKVPNDRHPVTTSTCLKGRFQFTEPKFDDGWNAVERKDWVEVSKGGTKVYLYYIFPMGNEMRPPNGNIRDNIWNKVVKDRFTIISETEQRSSIYSQNEWKEGEAIDKITGQKVYLAMSWNGTLNIAASSSRAESYELFPGPGDLDNMDRYK